MEIDEIDEISDEIIKNILEFVHAEFILNFKPKNIPLSNAMTISLIMFTKLLIISINNTSNISGVSLIEIYDDLEIRDKLKAIMDKKNES